MSININEYLFSMLISSDHLQNLPVFIESGAHLGHVRRWDMDVESHEVTRYYVKPSGLVQMLSSEELVVTPTQVVGITEQQMTVLDSVAADRPALARKRSMLANDATPALPRES